jgi:hypothetical protein
MPFKLVEDEPQESSILQTASEYGQEALRHTSRTASNLATRAVGLPGDILSLVNDFIVNPSLEYATGQEQHPYEESNLGKILPTTESHRKNLETVSGEYLKPQNKIEKFADDVIEDATMLMNPLHIAKKGFQAGSKLFKSFAKSIGANFAGETTKQVSQNENAGNLTKAGSLFMLSLLDQEGAAKQVSKLYKNAEAHLPENASISASTIKDRLDKLEKSITKRRPIENLSPPEKFVIQQVDKVKNLIQDERLNIEQAVAQKRSLNKELSTLYKEVPKHSDQKTVKSLAKQVNGFLNEAIEDYGKTNKKFYGPYKDADKAYGVLAKSNFITHWIDSNIVQHPLTTGLLHVLSPATSVAATAIIPYHATKILYRIQKSPVLRKIYGETLKSAAKEDSRAFNKYLKELDEKLQKEELTDKYRFID